DQLRQRVALALSEIFVISDNDGDLAGNGYAFAAYHDILTRGAFGSFRQLLQDVTLSPAMGVYLDMQGNDKENPAEGLSPNENYAREVNQLFSIGLYKLFPDGTLQLDAQGLPIATYSQDTIIGFAHVFTGWSFGGNPVDEDHWWWPDWNFKVPMQSWPAHH